METRKLDISEYDEILKLWRKSELDFHEGFRDTKPEIKKQIESGCVTIYGAFEEGALVGSVLCSDDSRRGWINHIAVLPEYRKKGIAVKLIEEAESHFDKKGLKIIAALVEDKNKPSWNLFEKCGYKQEFPGLRYYTKREKWGV